MSERKTVFTPEEIRKRISDVDFNSSQCARETGLHVNTIRLFRAGRIANQKWDTMVKLSDYLEGIEIRTNKKDRG